MVDRQAVRFFAENAGSIVGECWQGAIALARAEQTAQELDFSFEWEWDDGADLSWMTDKEREREHQCEALVVRLGSDSGSDRWHRRPVLATLSGIIDRDRNYTRVVEAELAMEAIGSYVDLIAQSANAHAMDLES